MTIKPTGDWGYSYHCTLCNKLVHASEIHICQGTSWPTIQTPTSSGTVSGMIKDINWKEYIPARRPESGAYLVCCTNLNGDRDWFASDYDKETYTWSDMGEEWIVTHYAKIEFP